MIPVRALRDVGPEERSKILRRTTVLSDRILDAARKIVDEVRSGGDPALLRLTRRLDGVEMDSVRVPEREIAPAESRISSAARSALRSAWESVLRFHRETLPHGAEFDAGEGITVGRQVVPYATAGLYVPGGRARYPSSLVMAAAPAVVAGVPRCVLCSPPGPEGRIADELLAVAHWAGIREVFRVGGAQAVAAMAFGTETVPRCEIVVGPGNAYVTAAKHLLRDEVAIDFLAGPTEILVLSDGSTLPRYIAADMTAQAEHDPDARAILVTVSREQAAAVAGEIEAQLATLTGTETARLSLQRNGIILTVDDLDAAIEFANEYAPEHLVLSCGNSQSLLRRIRNAGAVFVGESSPVAAGDYGVGPNAILPTLGTARFRSGLSAETFVKTIAYARLTPAGLARIAPTAVQLARLEGLEAHRRSIEMRVSDHGCP